jgi:His/Glu/Gln/Arg/opine family amino acid ABC transporter permease subunit
VRHQFSLAYLEAALPDLFGGLITTLQVSLVSIALAAAIGVAVAPLRLFGVPVLAPLAAGYVAFIRSTPLLPQIFFIFFGLASLGLPISDYWSGVLALSLWGGAYNTENVRGGFLAVPRGLREAADALGLRPLHYILLVALPVALRVAVPSMLNTSVSVLKNSAYLQTIGLAELTYVAMDRVASDFRTLEMFAALGIAYLVLVLLLSLAARRLEQVLQRPFRPA